MSKAEESGLCEDGIKFYSKMRFLAKHSKFNIPIYINTFIEIFFICHNRKVKTTLEFINQFRFLTIGRKTRAVKSKVLFRNL